jgi:succinyl-CoA synthetase beta subunit
MDKSALMLGHKLFTKQTGPDGKVVNKVLVAKRHFVRREAYFAILLDRSFGGPVMVGSSEGGVDIEKVAEENPGAIVKCGVDLDKGPSDEQSQKIATALGFKGDQVLKAQKQISNLYKFFREKDCTMLEINPMVETSDGQVMCMDAKINFDDNSEFRQRDIFELEDVLQKDSREVEAKKWDLNYIALDGSIGCLVNGAGLAMATMDIIKLHGGNPANFLDVGGGASKQQVTAAIRILNSDPKVKVILVNIFGGIMKCDIIALGLIAAATELGLRTPLIVRLQGTNVNEAKKLLADSGLRIMTADDLDDAAQKAVNANRILTLAEQSGLDVKFELPL